MATGDIRIDSLLALPGASLATNHGNATGAVITYSFLKQPNSNVSDFRSFDQIQQTSVHTMLEKISAVTGIVFRYVEENGLLNYGLYSGGALLADGSKSKGQMNISDTGATVWLNWTVPEVQNLASGYGLQLAVHETGHALGLKHPGQYSAADTGPFLPAELATVNHTIMSYNGGNSDHLGDFDILALQYLWGSSSTAITNNPNAVTATSTYTNGSYFNDHILLDIDSFNSSVSINGLTGLDELYINLASSQAVFSSDLTALAYYNHQNTYTGVFLHDIERIHFSDKTLALDITGNAGQAYRLYQAAFDRTPDQAGLTYWVSDLDSGHSLQQVAQGFVDSVEFKQLNPEIDQHSLINSFYLNVLHRQADQAGFDYWDQQMTGGMKANEVLISFSESQENITNTASEVQSGIWLGQTA